MCWAADVAGCARSTPAASQPPHRSNLPPSSPLLPPQALAARPALALLAVDSTFQHYAGGVWSSPTCAHAAAPNHALLVVGYSTEKPGFENFLAKNSLGASWGERQPACRVLGCHAWRAACATLCCWPPVLIQPPPLLPL